MHTMATQKVFCESERRAANVQNNCFCWAEWVQLDVFDPSGLRSRQGPCPGLSQAMLLKTLKCMLTPRDLVKTQIMAKSWA